MDLINPEKSATDMLLEGSMFLRLRRIIGAIVLLTGAVALLIYGPGLLR